MYENQASAIVVNECLVVVFVFLNWKLDKMWMRLNENSYKFKERRMITNAPK